MRVNNNYFKKYIKAYCWVGYFEVDGGWGPKRKLQSILDFNDPMLSGIKSTLFVTPIYDPVNSTSEILNEKYSVVFAGENYKEFINLVNTINKEMEKDSLFILQSIDSKSNLGTLRLTVNLSKDKSPIYNIYQGEMKPDFSHTKKISSWQ